MNNIILNRLFSNNIFERLLTYNEDNLYRECVNRFLKNTESTYNKDLIKELYRYLHLNYRNEYYYKNILVNKLLIGRHSLNTTIALSELPINKSIADFILVNGKATVYEIKTELDDFSRLENQINDYYKAFTTVNILTSEGNYKRLKKSLTNDNVGIYVLTKRNTISTRRKPREVYSNLDHTTMFKLLRKHEYEAIIQKHYSFLPKTKPVFYFKECLRLFEKIEVYKAHKYVISELKNRDIKEKELFMKVPKELKGIAYFSNYDKETYIKLEKFMNQKWGG